MSVYWLDIVIVFILLCTTYWGYRDGVTGQMLRVLGIILSLVIGFKLTGTFAKALFNTTQISMSILRPTVFVILIVSVFLFLVLVRTTTQKFLENTIIFGKLEKLGGACIGFFKGILAVFAILLIIASMPSEAMHRQLRKKTVVAAKIIVAMPAIYDYLTNSWDSPMILSGKTYLNSLAEIIQKKDQMQKRL